MKDTSWNDFQVWWSDKVATHLGLTSDQILDAFSSSTYSTDSKTRAMLKYSWSKGVFATPTVFLNGVMLDDPPFSVDGWLDLLNEVYEEQPQPTAFFLQ